MQGLFDFSVVKEVTQEGINIEVIFFFVSKNRQAGIGVLFCANQKNTITS